MKPRKPKNYSILIVPEKNSHIRRLEFSRRSLMAMLTSVAVAFVAVFACMLTMVHYYRAYQSTEDARVRAAQFERERTRLISEVRSLGDSLLRTQRFAAKLETIAKDDKGTKTSLGPLEERFKSLKSALLDHKADDDANKGLWRPPLADITTDELLTKIDLMKDNTAVLEDLIHETFAKQQDKMFFWASVPTLWPARGFLTSRFGVSRGRRLHEGIDIAGPTGTSIVAPGDGIVTFTGYKGGYGNTLKLDHGYGITTVHAHCSKIFAQEGDRVKRGEVIAAVGNTGYSTGPHLHYEVHIDGAPVDPMRYLAKR